MLDYIKEFSIIHRGGIMLAEEQSNGERIPGHAVPYIFLILGRPGISQEDISREFRLDKSAVARTVRKMEEHGLVERRSNPKDKRQYMIYPTEKLIRTHEENEKKRRDMDKLMVAGIDPEELAVFEKVLMQIRTNVTEAVQERKGSEK